MVEEYIQKTSDNDPVYHGLLWKLVDDSPHNIFLGYQSFLSEQLNSLREGKMPVKVYNNFLKKGVLGVLSEMKKKEDKCNSKLLKKLNFRD